MIHSSTSSMNSLNTPLAQATAQKAEQVGAAAEHAVQQVRERVLPAAVRLASQAEDMAHRGVEAVRESGEHLRQRALQASDRSIGYVREEPVKAVLIAAAAGAALMALTRYLSQRRV